VSKLSRISAEERKGRLVSVMKAGYIGRIGADQDGDRSPVWCAAASSGPDGVQVCLQGDAGL